MIRFTSSFIRNVKDRRSELIALLSSVLLSSFFLVSFALCFQPVIVQWQVSVPPRATPRPIEGAQVAQPTDPNEEFRAVPENFAHIDFNNWSYGRYRFWGKKLNLTLEHGEQEYPLKEGGGGETFSLRDVFYKDITGDGKPEAIVIITHVDCGVSCDGGSFLFYIYENRKGTLRKLWEYETGSMAYGCGLKSFTVSDKWLFLEMFGHCWQPASSFEVSGKFMVRDHTLSVFRFKGSSFVRQRTEITAAPAADLRSYTPPINLSDF